MEACVAQLFAKRADVKNAYSDLRSRRRCGAEFDEEIVTFCCLSRDADPKQVGVLMHLACGSLGPVQVLGTCPRGSGRGRGRP